MRRERPLPLLPYWLGSLCALMFSLVQPAAAQDAHATRPTWDPATVERNLRTRLNTSPQDSNTHSLLAELLAGQSRLDEAIACYRTALKLEPQNPKARIGLARALAWVGQTTEASTRFRMLLADNPDDLEALFGLGQVARWSGRNSQSRMSLRRGIELDPNDPRFPSELASLELTAGRPTTALSLAIEARRLGGETADLIRAVELALAPSMRVKSAFSDESPDFQRTSTRGRFEFSPLPDTRVRITPGFDSFDDNTGEIKRYSLGARIHRVFEHDFYAVGSYSYHDAENIAATHGIQGELGVKPFDLPLKLWVGGRRRAVVDEPLGYEDVAHLEAVGSGGSTLGAIRSRRQTSEVYGGLSTSFFPGNYGYGTVVVGWINDGNQSLSATAGIGVDLIQLLKGPPNQHLTIKYDYFFRDIDDEVFDYWSPSNFHVQTPGLDWRWQPISALNIGLEAGIPFKIGETPGWIAGGFVAFQVTERVQLEARFRHTEDTAFRITSATMALGWGF